MRNIGLIYGTQYYRPPNPPAVQHRFHLEKIAKELGFNLVKFRLQWNAIHRTADRLDLDEVHAMFDLCDELGLKVMVEVNLETAPYWLERRYPETRYVSANGHAVELGPYDATESGGYPGLCFHNQEVLNAAESYLSRLINEIKARDSLLAYDCWNEPHLEPAWICNYWGNMGDRLYCYCEASRQRFRHWLMQRHGSVEGVNGNWARMYGSWEEIQPPNRHGTYADWMDWGRFWFDSLREQMRWRYRVIKAADGNRFVMSHSGAVPPFLARPNAFIHNWHLAAEVDKWGTSFAPKYHNWSLAECAGTLEASRSAARGKEFWVSEMSGGSTYRKGFEKTPVTREKDIRAWNWLALACGAKAIVYWCYLTESTGPEAGSFGLISFDGRTTPRALEAARQKRIIAEHLDVIDTYQPVPDVALLYDPDNSNLLFAMEGGDEYYCKSHIGYYKALWEQDLRVRYVTGDNLDDLREPVLIVPMCLSLSARTADRMREYVRTGGTLLLEGRTGLFDERGFLQPDLPSFCLGEVAGVKEGEALCSDPDNRPWLNNPDKLPWPDESYGGPPITMEAPFHGGFRIRGYLCPLELRGAQRIGAWGQITLAAHHRYGEGETFTIGSYLGLALAHGDPGAKDVLLQVTSRRCAPPVRGSLLRPRLMAGEHAAILAVFNDSPSERRTDRIELPAGYSHALDVLDGCRPVPTAAGAIELCVEPEDVAVLRLEK